jgi:hypothetical protein
MGTLKNEYKSFLEDIEKNIKNKEDIEYVKGRFAYFLDIVIDQMDYIMDYKEEEMKKLEETQKDLSSRIEQMQQVIDNIEKDIYTEEGFDFEIVCPYCNYEFIIDVDENKTEIQCPECQNIIELDWSGDMEGDKGCSGNCHGCHDCDEDDDM